MFKISVVVPTYKRRPALSRCLFTLFHQSMLNWDYEIIVVDDEKSHLTRKMIDQLRNQNPWVCLSYFSSPFKGPAAARNWGWQHARGEIIAFTDDDCVPDVNWLKEGYSIFYPPTNTGGTDEGLGHESSQQNAGHLTQLRPNISKTYPIQADAIWGKVAMSLPSSPTDFELNAYGLAEAEFVTANCFVRKRVLEEIGGFDQRFTRAWREDSDLFFSLIKKDKKIGYASSVIVQHPLHPARFGISLSQQKNNLFEALLFRKHPKLYKAKMSSRVVPQYYAATISLLLAIILGLSGEFIAASLFLVYWLAWTSWFTWKRLKPTSKHPKHVLDMLVTSVAIPPAAVFWRIAGAIKFRVIFW